MRYFITIAFIALFFTLIIACGGSELEQGDKSFADGNYTMAINHYLRYKKDHPQDAIVRQKLTLAYMGKGKSLFDKTGNIKAFAGNFKKAQQYISAPTGDSLFNSRYSAYLTDFALAYHQARPENDIQKEQYFNLTLDYLNDALNFNPENSRADSILQDIYDANFQKMFDKGLTLYKQALKKKNVDLYISAEHYLQRADRFRPGDEETEKYLSRVRRKTLSILRNTPPFSFCVASYKQADNHFLTDITMANFTSSEASVSPRQFSLELSNGAIVTYDAQQTEKFEKGITSEQQLAPRQPVDGVLAFTLPAGAKVTAMIFTDEATGRNVTKYFP